MKNNKWAIESKVYDSGRVEMSKPIKVDWNTESIRKNSVLYDYYFDVFTTKKEAQDFYNENKFA